MNLFTKEWRIRSIPNRHNEFHYIIEVRRPIYYFWRVPRFQLRNHIANKHNDNEEWPSFKYRSERECKKIIADLCKEYLKKKHFKRAKPKLIEQGTFVETGFIENI